MAKARIVSDAGHPIILRGNREEPEEREKSLPTGSIPQKKKGKREEKGNHASGPPTYNPTFIK
jgi:hypothetical protein